MVLYPNGGLPPTLNSNTFLKNAGDKVTQPMAKGSLSSLEGHVAKCLYILWTLTYVCGEYVQTTVFDKVDVPSMAVRGCIYLGLMVDKHGAGHGPQRAAALPAGQNPQWRRHQCFHCRPPGDDSAHALILYKSDCTALATFSCHVKCTRVKWTMVAHTISRISMRQTALGLLELQTHFSRKSLLVPGCDRERCGHCSSMGHWVRRAIRFR